MRTTIRLRLAYAALAVTDTALAGSRSRWAHRARVLTKPLLMPVLAAAVATDERAPGSPLRATTLAGEAAGWVGDVFLLREDDAAFVAGASSFGIGHLAYIAGFVTHRDPSTPFLRRGTTRAVAGVWMVTAPVLAAAAARRQRVLGPVVLGYAKVLASMVATAAALDPALPRDARALTTAGAVLFQLSDSTLGARTFLLTDPPARLESVVMATYTAAQYLLAEGALRASPRG